MKALAPVITIGNMGRKPHLCPIIGRRPDATSLMPCRSRAGESD